MRLKHLSLLTGASLLGLLVHAGLSPGALAQTAAALTGQVDLGGGRPDGRRFGERQEARLDLSP